MADAPRHLTYEVVQHDGGWAYKLGDVFSETFKDHDSAHKAAERAAREHQRAGSTEYIEYEDRQGEWHEERADGRDRPETRVKDQPGVRYSGRRRPQAQRR